MCEAGPVENVGMHMVGVGESADWLEYVLVVGKAKKKKVFIFLKSIGGLSLGKKIQTKKAKQKKNKVFDQPILFFYSFKPLSTDQSSQAILVQFKRYITEFSHSNTISTSNFLNTTSNKELFLIINFFISKF